MTITDDMISRAIMALHHASGGDIDVTGAEMRAALAAALSAQPAPDSVHSITTAYEQGFGHALRDDLTNPYTPGSGCSLAWDIGRKSGARIARKPVPLPALPEPAYRTNFGAGLTAYSADQMTAYARQCLAAAGVTVAEKE